jgi:hypothetical protein
MVRVKRPKREAVKFERAVGSAAGPPHLLALHKENGKKPGFKKVKRGMVA